MRWLMLAGAAFLAIGACSRSTQEHADAAARQAKDMAVSAAHDASKGADKAAAVAKVDAAKAERKAHAAEDAASHTN